MARSYYQIAVRHSGLNKYRVVRGAERSLVEAAAATQQRAWDAQYARKVAMDERRKDRDDKRQELEDNLREAEERTREAESALEELRGVLAATLRVDDRVDWAAMMKPRFSQPEPKQIPYLSLPPEPVFDPNGWKRNGFVIGLIPFLAKRAEEKARREFEIAHAKWVQREQAVEATNAKIYADNLREYEDWKRRAEDYEAARGKHNSSIEQARIAYQALNPDAILDYCDLVLSRSQYPDCFPKQYELDYRASTKTLSVEYQVPNPDDLPRLENVKFSRTKGDFVEAELNKRDFEQLYSDVVFQVAIRTIHELFEADVVRALDAVILTSTVHTLNPGTGHQEDRCIASVRAERAAFEAINLRNIESRACFESLGGIAGAKMLDCRAVKSLATIDRSEQRFAGAQDVTSERATSLDEWQELVKTISDPQEIRFLPVGTLASLMGFPTQQKLTVGVSKELVEAVAARGFAIEPDARYGAASYRADEEIALFRPLATTVTTAYPGMAALLQLCVVIAAADDQPTEQELEVVRDFFRHNATLTRHEQQRLLVLESYLCRNTDTAKRSLSRMAKRLPPAQRRLVGEVLVCVAGADGIISSAEWPALDRAFKALELPPTALDEILRKLGASFEEPLVQEAEPPLPGEPLPIAEPVAAHTSFKLDMSRVAAISHETSEVISLLSAVMSEEDQKPATPTPPAEDVKRRIHEDLRELQEYVGGFTFAEVLAKYYEGYETGNEALQGNALRWLRGEYSTKTEARQDLGVREIIDDENIYDGLKLMAAFCKKAGYGGLLVGLDELVVLSHRLPNTRVRQANYEALLSIINDCFQGGVAHLGFLLAGTDECLEDKRRGLYSYEALRSRLVENSFAVDGVRDLSGPVVRLQNLTPEDLFVLLRNIRHVHANGDTVKYLVPDEALVAVLQRANETLGAEYFKTPRDVVRSFVGLLNVLEQNPTRAWPEFVGANFIKVTDTPLSVEEEVAKGSVQPEEDDDLQTFKL